MALNQTTLAAAIKAAFKKAKETPPPDDPSQADQLQEDILTQLSADLAAAIFTFVKAGDVVNVTTDVTFNPVTSTWHGTQNNLGDIQ